MSIVEGTVNVKNLYRLGWILATGVLATGTWATTFSAGSGRPAAESASSHHHRSTTASAPPDAVRKQQLARNLAKQPLRFEENRGQFAADTRFLARGAGYAVALNHRQASIALRSPDNGTLGTVLFTLAGANDHAVGRALDPLSAAYHYYRGDQRVEGARAYAKARFDGVYDGIDVVYYGNQDRLEYDFIVEPGVDPDVIRLRIDGAKAVSVDANGDLVVSIEGGEPIRQHRPIVYQTVDGVRRDVASRYVVSGRDVRFALGDYDAAHTLVIDPILAYSSFFGGKSEEFIADIAIDAAGNIYVTGRATDNPGFPTTANAFQKARGSAESDAFVSKFNAAGTQLLYSTLLGGAGAENATERPGVIAVDGRGFIHVAGDTASTNFPLTPNAYDNDNPVSAANPTDAFYSAIRPDGTLAYSTYIGGSRSDEANGIAVDALNNVYVTGMTNSVDGTFPQAANAFDTTPNGNTEAYLIKFDAAFTRVYSTFLGGNSAENTASGAGSVAVISDHIVALTGDTFSDNFPTKNPFQATYTPNAHEGFLTVLDTTKAGAAGLVYSTYFGGANYEIPLGIASDGQGIVVIGGIAGANMPLRNALFPTMNGGVYDGFIAKFDVTKAGNASLLWSTYLGAEGNGDAVWDVALDAAGNVYAVGNASDDDFPLLKAIRTTHFVSEGFLASITSDGAALRYSTFFGGDDNGRALHAVAVHQATGSVVIGGQTGENNTDPPTPSGHPIRNAYQTTNGGGDGDGFLAIFADQSDLGISMTAAPEPVLPNNALKYTIRLTNPGPDAAEGVAIQFELPAEVAFVNCVSNGGACQPVGPRTYRVTVGRVVANGVITVTTNTTVADGLPIGGTFEARAAVFAANDRNPANNTANFVSHIAGPDPNDTDGDGMPNQWEDDYGVTDPGLDEDNDGRTNGEEYEDGSHPRGFVITYLAEGATGAFFDTRLAVANPTDAVARILFRFQKDDGTVVSHYRRIQPHSRYTLDVETVPGMQSASFSTLLEGDVQVVADRTMSWDQTGYGSHAEHGTLTRAATEWYLAEGATHGAFDLFYLVQNPGDAMVDLEVTFLRPAPRPPVVKTYQVRPHSRLTIYVDQIAELAAEEMSAVLRSTNGQPIIVERAMYMTTGGVPFRAGHNSAGVTAPSQQWFLAEGATGPFFDMFMLVGNPGAQKADLTVNYLLLDGTTVQKTYEVQPRSRLTVNVELEDPLLRNAALSTVVNSTAPVIVERVQWWPDGGWYEAHNSPGETETNSLWALAEGETGGPRAVSTYILVANTSPFAGAAKVTLLFEDGATVEKTFGLKASSRTNINVGELFPESLDKRYSALVQSVGDTPAAIVVERAMYTTVNGVVWEAGANALGTKLGPRPQ